MILIYFFASKTSIKSTFKTVNTKSFLNTDKTKINFFILKQHESEDIIPHINFLKFVSNANIKIHIFSMKFLGVILNFKEFMYHVISTCCL